MSISLYADLDSMYPVYVTVFLPNDLLIVIILAYFYYVPLKDSIQPFVISHASVVFLSHRK